MYCTVFTDSLDPCDNPQPYIFVALMVENFLCSQFQQETPDGDSLAVNGQSWITNSPPELGVASTPDSSQELKVDKWFLKEMEILLQE